MTLVRTDALAITDNTIAIIRDGVLAGLVIVASALLAFYCIRQQKRRLGEDRLVLGILLIGFLAALAFPGLLENPVVAGLFGTIAGSLLGRSDTPSPDAPQVNTPMAHGADDPTNRT
jgi:membrane associated rhomboid family serine protease